EMTDVPGEIQGIKLEIAAEHAPPLPAQDPKDAPEASFEVSLSKEEDCAWTSIEIAGVSPTKRTFQMETTDRAMLLDAELEVFSHDRIYEEALAMAGLFIRGTSPKEPEGPRKMPTGEPVSSGAYRAKPPGARPK